LVSGLAAAWRRREGDAERARRAAAGGLNRVWLGFLVRAPLLYPPSPGLWGWIHKTTGAFVQRCEVTISYGDGRCAYGLGALRSGQSRFGFQLQFIPNIHDRALNMRPELTTEQEVREDKEIDKSECISKKKR
jgi:hypothetical protein